ncbi:MAG: hypothetical protein RL369_90 [Pseudomonadota bacterium]
MDVTAVDVDALDVDAVKLDSADPTDAGGNGAGTVVRAVGEVRGTGRIAAGRHSVK